MTTRTTTSEDVLEARDCEIVVVCGWVGGVGARGADSSAQWWNSSIIIFLFFLFLFFLFPAFCRKIRPRFSVQEFTVPLRIEYAEL